VSKLAEAERPAKVVVAIMTDGGENASREFKKAQIEKMIKAKTDENHWDFLYQSADLAAFREAGEIGIHAMSRMVFEKSGKGTSEAWSSLSKAVSDVRSGRKQKIGFGAAGPQPAKDPKGKEA